MALAALLAIATGQTITPLNWTAPEAAKQDDDAIDISVSVGNDMVRLGPVLALTDMAKNGIPVQSHASNLAN